MGSLAGGNNLGSNSVIIGRAAGLNNADNDVTLIGFSAGQNNAEDGVVAIGYETGFNNAGRHLVAIGESAAFDNTGDDVIAIGEGAGGLNAGNDAVLIGEGAGESNAGDNVVFIGTDAAWNFSSPNSVAIGYEALSGDNVGGTETGANNIAIGYRAAYDISSPGVSNNIFIGYQVADNIDSASNNILIGHDIDLQDPSQTNQLSIGNLIFGTGLGATGTTTSTGSIGIGTTTPIATFAVEGDIYTTATATVNNLVIENATTGTTTDSLLVINTSTGEVRQVDGSEVFSASTTDEFNTDLTFSSTTNTISSTDGGGVLSIIIDALTNITLFGTTVADIINVNTLTATTTVTTDLTATNATTTNLIATNATTTDLVVLGTFQTNGATLDSDGDAGTADQVLVSTATGTNWVSVADIETLTSLSFNSASDTLTYIDEDGATTTINLTGLGGLWSDAGSNIYYDLGNVGIGVAGSPSALFDVGGNYTIDSTGRVDVDSAFTTSGVSGDDRLYEINSTITSGGSHSPRTLYLETVTTGTTDFSGVVIGQQSELLINSGATHANAVGQFGRVRAQVSTDITSAIGLAGGLRTDSGVTWSGTEAAVVEAELQNFGTLNVTDFSFFSADLLGSGAVNSTNLYGLYLPNLSTLGATNSYGIYSEGGDNYFAGNVGIGTTTPAVALDVAGTGRIDELVIGENGVSNLGYLATLYEDSGNSALMHFINADTTGGTLMGLTSSEDFEFLNLENTDVVFSTNGAPRLTIAADGNVGIGTTTPDNLLSLGATASPISLEGATDDAFETVLAVTDPTADNTITFQDGSGVVAFTSDFSDDAETLDGIDSSAFLRSNASDSFSGGELLILDNSFLSVGTGGDLRMIHQSGDSTIESTEGDLYIDNRFNTGQTYLLTGTDDANTGIEFLNNSETRLFEIDGTGVAHFTNRLGINEADPSNLLSLGAAANPLSFEGATANAFETVLALVDPTADNTITLQDGSGTLAFLSDVAAVNTPWSSSSTDVYYDSGNVGIGVAGAPSSLFDVAGNFTVDALGEVTVGGDIHIGTNSGSLGIGDTLSFGSLNHEIVIYPIAPANTPIIQFIDNTTGTGSLDGFLLGLDSSDNTFFRNSEGGDFDFYGSTNGNTVVATISNSGQLGLGGADPTNLLTLGAGTSPISFEGATDNAFETVLAVTDPTTDNTITLQNDSGTLAFLSDITDLSYWNQNATDVFYDTGNVGIGVAGAPGALFDVGGNYQVDSTGRVDVNATYTTQGVTGNDRLYEINASVSSHSASVNTFPRALFAQFETTGSTNFSGSVEGLQGQVILNGPSSHGNVDGLFGRATVRQSTNVGVLTGLKGSAAIDGGDSLSGTSMIAVQAELDIDGTSNTTNTALFSGSLPGTGSVSSTNFYGLFLPNITGATNNYGIYSAGGDNYLAGALEVDGNIITNLTANSIPFIGTNGLLTQDNTNFSYDNTNDTLQLGGAWTFANNAVTEANAVITIQDDIDGIAGVVMRNANTGTSSDYRFLVESDDAGYLAFAQPGTNNTGVLFGRTRGETSLLFTNGANRDFLIGTVDTGDLVLNTNNTDRLTISSTGEVDIPGSLSVQGAFLDSDGDVGAPGNVLQTTATGTNWVAAASGTTPWTSAGSDIYFVGGNVGIGTSTPSELFDVGGNYTVDSTGRVSATRSYTVNSDLADARSYEINTTVVHDGGGNRHPRGLYANVNTSGANNFDGYVMGLQGQVSLFTGANHDRVAGLYGRTLTEVDTTVDTAIGMTGVLQTSGSVTLSGTDARVLQAELNNLGTINSDNLYLFGGDITAAGTIGSNNFYGLYLPNITGAVNNYGIYSEGGDNYLAGRLEVDGIGDFDTTIDVADYIRVDNNSDRRALVFENSLGDDSILHTVDQTNFGHYAISLGVDENAQHVSNFGAANMFFFGRNGGGEVSLNAADTGTAGGTVDFAIGLNLDSADQFLRIGDPSNTLGLHTGAGFIIADHLGNLYAQEFTASSTSSFSGAANFAGISSFNNSANFTGAATFSGATEVNNVLTLDNNSNSSGLRILGVNETTEIADIYVGNGGQLHLDNTNGSGALAYLDIRTENDDFGMVLLDSSGGSLTPYANFYMNDDTVDYLHIIANDTNGGGTALVISAQDRVGIGDQSPDEELKVVGGACVASSAADTCNTSFGDIDADGSINPNNFDLAENFLTNDETLSPGEIITFDPEMATTKIVRATTDNVQVLGVISTNPAVVMGYSVNPTGFDESMTRPVGLAGRVPVNVNLDNGPIEVGDYLTLSSSTPGTAMKSTEPGDYIIGFALEPYNTEIMLDEGENPEAYALDTENPLSSDIGQVLMFIQNNPASLTDQHVATLEEYLTPTEIEEGDSYAARFFQNLFEILKDWFASLTNGIEIFVAERLQATEEICVDDTCLDENDIRNLLQLLEESGYEPTPDPEPTPEESTEPEADPAPEETPTTEESTSSTDPEPTPDPTPEPEPTPEPDPDPVVEPEPTPEESTEPEADPAPEETPTTEESTSSTDPEPTPDPTPEPEPTPEPDPDPVVEPEPTPDPEPEPVEDPTPEPTPETTE